MTDRPKGSLIVQLPDDVLADALKDCADLIARLRFEDVLRQTARETGATVERSSYSPYCRAPGCCDWNPDD